MYEYIQGTLAQITPTCAVVEAGGIGYYLHISLQTYTPLASQNRAKLYLHHIQREDAQQLFGFYTLKERELFRLLISVSGIGVNTARIILSSYEVDEVVQIIATGNVAALKNVKGIGLKTAERVIVDLRNKVLNVGGISDEAVSGLFSEVTGRIDEAMAALMTLGYSRAACEKVVKTIGREQPELTSEEIIRLALGQL